jgi:hypothetical protein
MNGHEARSQHIKRTLKRCALELHPSGEFKHLARKMALQTHAFSDWIRKGRVPHAKAVWLEEHFPEHARASTLVSGVNA